MTKNSVRVVCVQPVYASSKESSKVDLINPTEKIFSESWTDVTSLDHENLVSTTDEYISGLISKKNSGRIYILNDCLTAGKSINNIFFSKRSFEGEHEAHLYYDNSNKLFFLIHSIVINFERKITPAELSDVLAEARLGMVLDNNISGQKRWKSVVEKEVKAIKNIAYYSNFKSLENLDVLPNTGHLCMMAEPSVVNIDDADDYKKHLHKMDIQEKVIDVKSESTLRSIGWRLSTLVHESLMDSFKFIPAIINVQNIYFKINKVFKPYISELHDSITLDRKVSSLSVNLLKFDNLLIDFHNMHYQKTNFINSQEPIKISFYNKIEEYWYVSSDFENISKTLDVYQSTISRKVESVNSASQENQNSILFVLTVIQVLALVGVFTDYFGFFNLATVEPGNNIEKAYFFIASFMRDWVPYIAIVILILSLTLIMNAFKKWLTSRRFINGIFKSNR